MGFLDAINPLGGGNAVEGLSAASSERQQRQNVDVSRLGLQAGLDQQALFNYFLTGQFNQGHAPTARGALTEAPGGTPIQLVQQGLEGELGLSAQRQALAEQLLGQTGSDFSQTQGFNTSALQQGTGGIEAQAQLLGQLPGTFAQDQGLNNQLTNQLGNYFNNLQLNGQFTGDPTQGQQQQIGDIFNAQRAIGQSNLSQQFGDAIQQLQDQATTRGLRFGDTPIQDRGNRLTEEFARNATNLESSLSGQQANALLQYPLQSQQVNLAGQAQDLNQINTGAQLQGQSQNQMLNLINAFSAPITQAQNANQNVFQQGQFGLNYSPASFSGIPLSNLNGLVGGGQFSTGQQGFAPTSIAQRPTIGQATGQAFGTSYGNSLGESAGAATAAGIGGIPGGLSSLGGMFG